MLEHYWVILLTTVLVNNFVLAQFLGLCPFMGVSRKIDTALGMGFATAFVLTLAAVTAWALDRYLLEPFAIEFLRTIAFIVSIAVIVGLTELFLAKTSPLLHRVLGVYLPLITTNCAVLGVALLNSRQQHNLLESAVYGLGAALGFTLVLVIFAALRERLDAADVPAPFKGTPIALITAGILAIAFTGFGGWT
ncbi:MAG: electron transport complex subunit RsxA [Cardiobacteriaceae bacterium]|nr:electron transport complex subunit RsxA [Cardiobacteriaceae bacterium]